LRRVLQAWERSLVLQGCGCGLLLGEEVLCSWVDVLRRWVLRGGIDL
jgi:hypothetical protein